MKSALKILILEDSITDAELIQRVLKKEKLHFEAQLAIDKESFLKALVAFSPDVILSDNSLPQFNAAEALKITRQLSLQVPFILVTGAVSEEFAANIIKSGADDYFLKDRLARLPAAIDAAVKKRRAEKDKLETLDRLILNEEKYRSLVERVSDGFIALDLNWNFIYANKKAEQLFKKPAGYLVGKNIWTEFPEAIDQSFFRAYQQAMETQENIHLKEYSMAIDKWVETNIYPSLTGISVYFRDITEKRKAELAIRNSEEVRRLIMNSALDAIICIDTSGKITVWNPQAEKMFGWTEQEITGKLLSETIIPEQYRKAHVKGMSHYSKTSDGPILNKLIEISALNKTGREFPIELAIVPIKQSGNDFFCAFIRDITERKKAEEALKEGEAKYRDVVENIHEALIIEDREGYLVYANTEFYKMFGYSPGKDKGLSLRDYTASESYEEVLERHNNRLKGMKVPEEFEYKGVRKDGTEIWIEARVSTVMENDKIVRTQSLERDITERKKAAEALIKNELRFREFFETAPEALLVVDPESGMFVDHNDNALKLLKCSGEELLKMRPENISPAFQPDGSPSDKKMAKYIASTMKGEQPIYDWVVIDSTEKEIYCEIRLKLLTNAVRPLIRVSVLDITDRVLLEAKLVEEKLKKQQEITDAVITAQERERSFLGEEMHDNINQLLATAKLYIDLTIDTNAVRKDLLIDSRNYVMTAMEEIRKLSKSLLPPTLGETSLFEVLDDVIESIEYADKLRITKDWEGFDKSLLNDKLSLTIFRIAQEQMNNIIKHAHAKNVIIALRQFDQGIQLSIKDDGDGFDTSEKRKGVGLKNMTSRAAQFNGEVIIHTKPGAGCELVVNFMTGLGID
jgi:PAS domain S-box-containing protein